MNTRVIEKNEVKGTILSNLKKNGVLVVATDSESNSYGYIQLINTDIELIRISKDNRLLRICLVQYKQDKFTLHLLDKRRKELEKETLESTLSSFESIINAYYSVF